MLTSTHSCFRTNYTTIGISYSLLNFRTNYITIGVNTKKNLENAEAILRIINH